MREVAAAKFKAQCLAIIDQVAQNHETLVVTKYGKPVVKVVPFVEAVDKDDKPLKGLATFIGDVVSPIDEEWDAAR